MNSSAALAIMNTLSLLVKFNSGSVFMIDLMRLNASWQGRVAKLSPPSSFSADGVVSSIDAESSCPLLIADDEPFIVLLEICFVVVPLVVVVVVEGDG